MDYQSFNNFIIKDQYPLPLIGESLDRLGRVKKILAKKLDIFVIVYLDGILIYTKDLGQGQVEAVRWVLDILRRPGLFVNLKKYWFHKDEVYFLGYMSI